MDIEILQYFREAAKNRPNETVCFIIREMLEMKYEDIGKILKLEKGSVRTNVCNGRKKFSDFLDKIQYFENKDYPF